MSSIDNTERTNNESLLEIIASCVEGSNIGSTRNLRVVVNNLSYDKLNKVNEDNTKKANKNNSDNTNRIIDVVKDNHKKEIETSKKLIEEIAKTDYSGLLNRLEQGLTKFFESLPILGGALSAASTLGFAYAKIQLENINDYRQLNSSGLLYNKDFKALYEDAGEIGISKDEYKKALLKNAQTIARLNGVTGDGLGTFKKFFEQVKKTSNSIGMDLNDSVNVISIVARNMYSDMELNQTNLNLVTEKYMKTLKTLSYWTGKSTESLISEVQKREDNAVYRTWASNSGVKAQIMQTVLDTFASEDFKADIARGMNTGSISKASAINPYLGKVYDEIMTLRQNMDNLSDDDFEKQLDEIMLSVKNEKMINYAKRIPTTVMAAYGEDLQNKQLAAFKLGQLGPEGYKKAKEKVNEPDPFIKDINDMDSKIKEAINKLLSSLTINKEDIDNAIIKPLRDAGEEIKKISISEDKSNYIVNALKRFFIDEHPIAGLIFGSVSFLTLVNLIRNVYNTISIISSSLSTLSSFLSNGKLGNFVNPINKQPSGMINTPGQQSYKEWAKTHPESKYMTKNEKINAFNKFKNSSKFGNMLNIGAKVAGAGYHGLEAYNNFSEGNTFEGIYQAGSAVLWAINPKLGAIIDTITDTIQIGTDAWINGIDSALDDYKKNGNNYLIKAGIVGSEAIVDFFYDLFSKIGENENDDENDIRMREIYGDKWDELKESLSNKQEETIKQLEMMNQQSEKQVTEMKSLDEEKRRLEKEKQQNTENLFNNIDESLRILNNSNNKNNNEEALKRLDEIKDVLNEIRVQNEQKENLTSY